MQRLFLVAALTFFLLGACNTAGRAPSLCAVLCAVLLRALREPRVSPEPLAVLEEQDGCDRDQHCRPTVLGQSFIAIRTKRRHGEGDECQ